MKGMWHRNVFLESSHPKLGELIAVERVPHPRLGKIYGMDTLFSVHQKHQPGNAAEGMYKLTILKHQIPKKKGEEMMKGKEAAFAYYQIEDKPEGKRIVLEAAPYAPGSERAAGMGVWRAFRKRNIASMMINLIKARAKGEGCTQIEIVSPPKGAVGFFEKQGFKPKAENADNMILNIHSRDLPTVSRIKNEYRELRKPSGRRMRFYGWPVWEETQNGTLLSVEKAGNKVFVVRQGTQSMGSRGVYSHITILAPIKIEVPIEKWNAEKKKIEVIGRRVANREQKVGYVYYKFHAGKMEAGGKHVNIDSITPGNCEMYPAIFVEPNYRRKNIASFLFQHLIERARGEGCKQIDIESPDEGGLRFFKSEGFQNKLSMFKKMSGDLILKIPEKAKRIRIKG